MWCYKGGVYSVYSSHTHKVLCLSFQSNCQIQSLKENPLQWKWKQYSSHFTNMFSLLNFSIRRKWDSSLDARVKGVRLPPWSLLYHKVWQKRLSTTEIELILLLWATTGPIALINGIPRSTIGKRCLFSMREGKLEPVSRVDYLFCSVATLVAKVCAWIGIWEER